MIPRGFEPLTDCLAYLLRFSPLYEKNRIFGVWTVSSSSALPVQTSDVQSLHSTLFYKNVKLTIVMAKNLCFYCGVETNNKKFCSRSCAAKESNKIPKRKLQTKCSKCENIVRNYKSLLCEQHYQLKLSNQRNQIESLSLEDYFNRESIQRLHPSSKYSHIRGLARSWFKDLTKLPCANCGYNKHVELCHIKPISSFDSCSKVKDVNSKTNIIQLCPNCHWEFDNGLLALEFPEQSESH